MTISIWRYSHFILAISSALFITIASVTGIILAFEPISKKLQPYKVEDLNTISIAEAISALENMYDEIITIEIDENNFVLASVITKNDKNHTFYIHPKTGLKIGDIIEKHPVFKFATNLHRSLFLKSTGRFLIGFASFLLFLIAITGIILIAKRQGGIHKFFSKVVKENFNQYYHIVFGKYALIPILIVTLTGVYLSLEKFSLLPKGQKKTQNFELETLNSKQKPTDFEFFNSLKLDVVRKIEFPFSKDKDEYFYVKTIDREFFINQFNGQIIRKKEEDFMTLGSYYSLLLHTGQGSILWSIILLLTCFAILFFVFSGFFMTFKRVEKKELVHKKIQKDIAEYIVLVGSETGSTLRFAIAFTNALLRSNKTVFMSSLNKYTTYENAKSIIIFTATYGDGEAPANANKFIKLIDKTPQKYQIKYAVLGFGSSKYPHFCHYAILVHASLQVHPKFIPTIPLFKIDNQNVFYFKMWVKEWSSENGIFLTISEDTLLERKKVLWKIVSKSKLNIDNTFLLVLKPLKKVKFTSGDLLAITPRGIAESRYYSIAKINKKLLLSIKKHELGICSNYLQKLNKGSIIKGTIHKNTDFHFPKENKEVVFIANGTGIAPFLGMMHNNKLKNKIHLFWGGKTKESFKIYDDFLETKNISTLHIAYSQENEDKVYVQDLLHQKKHLIINTIKNEGVVFICGSLAMREGVEKVLNNIVMETLNISLETLKEKNQMKIDCY